MCTKRHKCIIRNKRLNRIKLFMLNVIRCSFILFFCFKTNTSACKYSAFAAPSFILTYYYTNVYCSLISIGRLVRVYDRLQKI